MYLWNIKNKNKIPESLFIYLKILHNYNKNIRSTECESFLTLNCDCNMQWQRLQMKLITSAEDMQIQISGFS